MRMREDSIYLSDEQTKSNRPKERQQSSIKKKDWDFVIERLLLFAPSAPLLFFFYNAPTIWAAYEEKGGKLICR